MSTLTPQKTPRVAHPARLIFLAIIVALALIFSFFAGVRHASTGPTPEEQAAATVKVWGHVETRPVNDALNLAGTAKSGETVPITIHSEGEPVLVHRAKAPGDQVAPGDLIGIVGGEGVFALEGPLPLYRDLSLGDSGHDVQELQRALTNVGYRTNTDGTVTETTLKAVQGLLSSELKGLPEEGIKVIKRSNFAILPNGNHTVASAANVGEVITSETPLLTLEASAPYVEVSASLAEADRLASLETVTVKTSTGQTQARVQSVGEMKTGPQGSTKTVRLSVEDPGILTADQSVAVSSGGDDTPVLAVPVSAVRQDGSKTYILVPSAEGKEEEPQQLEVEVLRTGGGWAAISGNVAQGQEVLLS